MYELILENSSKTVKYSLPYEAIKITEELNKALSATVSMPYKSIDKYAQALKTSPDAIVASQPMNWRLLRNDTEIYSGILMDRKINGGNEGATAYQINLADFSARLNKRRTSQDFQRLATDSAEIVDDLLELANTNQNTGISMGTKPTTKDRDLTSRTANVRDEIVSMSNEKKKDGYDWDVDTTKKLNLYYPQKGELRAYIILDDFNIIKWQVVRPLEGKLTNKLYVLGEGYGDDQAMATSENSLSQGAWGLLEDVQSEKNVSTESELQDRGDKIIDTVAFPTETVSLAHKDGTPNITDYNVGDTVVVRIDEIGLNEQLRIIKRTIQIDAGGNATVDLSFEEKQI